MTYTDAQYVEESPDISLVIPVFNERDSLKSLLGELRDALEGHRRPFEIIAVDDGSTDGSREALEAESCLDGRISVLSTCRNEGQHKALERGFRMARGRVVVTMDADLQNDPADIPRLVSLLEQGHDVVCGWRRNRRDSLAKRIKSSAANLFQRVFMGLDIHDMSCTLRAYRKGALDDMTLKRRHDVGFIPFILYRRGCRIGEMPVNHRPRKFGRSKYPFFSTLAGVIVSYFNIVRKVK